MSRLTSFGVWLVADPARLALAVTVCMMLVMIAGYVLTLSAAPINFAGPTGGGSGGGG